MCIDMSASTRPTRVTLGKSSPLADHLGAHEDIDLSAPGECAEDLAEARFLRVIVSVSIRLDPHPGQPPA